MPRKLLAPCRNSSTCSTASSQGWWHNKQRFSLLVKQLCFHNEGSYECRCQKAYCRAAVYLANCCATAAPSGSQPGPVIWYDSAVRTLPRLVGALVSAEMLLRAGGRHHQQLFPTQYSVRKHHGSLSAACSLPKSF